MAKKKESTTETITLPLFCEKGHQIYILLFPQLNRYGFGCGVCHTMGTALTHGQQVLQVARLDNPLGLMDPFEELLMGRGIKAIHEACGPKGHYLMVFEFTQGFGVGCIHCKKYSLEFQNTRNEVFGIRVTRTLDAHDSHVRPLTGPVPEDDPLKGRHFIH